MLPLLLLLAQTLDAPIRNRVIDGALSKLDEYYVFPDTAKKMSAAIRDHQQRGEYDAVTDSTAFADLLTNHLRAVSHDKHLRVRYNASPLPGEGPGGRGQLEQMNCGFEKAQRLDGNIGYLKFNIFASPDFCRDIAISAMNSLAGSDAIIFDLRSNGGGDPAMVALISTYLFAERTHLNDIYNRADDHTEEFWTLRDVPGKRFVGAPVYVLTSQRTFSGAEEFTYNLKNLKRATIVGETTGGGAHPVSGHRLDHQFTIYVPFARAINPITKTNWEGTGVTPDISVPASDALPTAENLAREHLRKK